MKTYRNLYQQILEEVKKRGGVSAGEISVRGVLESLISPNASNLSVQAIYDYLGKALSEKIVSGIYVEADIPSSKYIWVRNKGEEGYAVKKGVLFNLTEDIKVEIPLPQPKAPVVFYLNLTVDNRVLVETSEHEDRIAIAKINIPSPNTLDIIDDYNKGSLSGYIVVGRDLCFKNDFQIDDNTINALRNNLDKLLADNLVGSIKLSEGLRILNARGTLEMDSEELRILYPSKVVGAKFNKDGTYFYDEQGKERARFTADDARIGNIRITGRTLENVNYETEGFQIKDTGEIDLKESHGYKMMLKPGGIFIRGMLCSINHLPEGDDYIRDVVLTRVGKATPTVISEDYYNFGAKNGQFIKKPACADNTATFPNQVYITYTTNEGTFSNEEHIFTMQDSVAAIITTDSQLDASYIRNLIVGKITNPAGNTYFDLLKGKLNIESSDLDEDNKFVIGDPLAGAGLRYDKSAGELLMSGIFSTTGSKNWDSRDDFAGEKYQVDIDTILGKILLERELASWLQTTQADFDAGTKTNIDTTTVSGTFRVALTTEAIEQEQTTQNTNTTSDGVANAQSFKPSINCNSTKVAVFITKRGSVPDITAYLKADDNNSPGSTLSSKTLTPGDVPTYPSWDWVIFDWTNVNLTANTRYWIYFPPMGSSILNCYIWTIQTVSNVYPSGNAWTSLDGHLTNSDFTFKIYEQHYQATSNLISQNHHFGTNFASWLPMVITKVLNGQTVTVKTQTAPDVSGSPGIWEEEKSLDAQDKPTSTIYSDTWFKWRAYLSTDGWVTPIVYDITANIQKKYYANGYDRLVWGFGNKVSYTTYSFVASEPTYTNAKVRFRCADTEVGLATATWSAYFDVSSGNMTDANIFDSIWIEAEVYEETTDTDITPEFDKLTVNFTQGLDVDKVDGFDASQSGGVNKILPLDANGNLAFPADKGIKTLVGARAYLSANQTIPSGTITSGGMSSSWTKIAFNTESYDLGNNYNTTLYRFVALVPGYYHIAGAIYFRLANVGNLAIFAMNKNGVTIINKIQTGAVEAGLAEFSLVMSDTIFLNANDYLDWWAAQNSGQDRLIFAGALSWISVFLLSVA